jgi:DNA-directed RNA polymerase subunit M/transcription elongation factor TFIIS
MTFCHKCGMQLPEGGDVKFCPNCGALLVPQAVQDKLIIAEFHYWDYAEFSKTAMKPRPEIKTEELEKIAREFNVKVEAKKAAASYFTPSRIGMRIPSYNRIEIQVSGEQPDAIKSCVGRIFMLYGQPDGVSTALSGGKKAGKKIIDELLREFNEGKR